MGTITILMSGYYVRSRERPAGSIINEEGRVLKHPSASGVDMVGKAVGE